jgi:RNA polymerase-binding transcription factor DksA
MAKKKTSKKKSPAKGAKKSSTKGKSKVTKKKTAVKKITTKKKATPKKAVKATAKKKVTAKKPTTKKAAVKKAAPKRKVAAKKTVTSKAKAIKTTTKKTSTKTVKKQEVKRVVKKPVITRAEALQKIKGFGKKDLEQFRTIILEKRDEILEDLQSLKEQMLDTSTGEYINENSPYSLHMAEQGTDAMEREKTFLYAQRENKFLGYLDDALKRIDNGTYGVCIECVEEPQHLCETCPLVPKARLVAVPHTQHCLPIKQRKGGR